MKNKKTWGIIGGLSVAVFSFIVWLAATAIFEKVPSPRKDVPRESVTIALPVSPSLGLIFIAQHLGYFEEEGLAVRIEEYPSGKEANEALLAGKADFAAAADIPFMFAVTEGKSLQLVSTIDTSEGHLTVVGRKDRIGETPRGVLGKRIGYTPGTGGQFFLFAWLTVHEIDENEVERVALPPEAIVSALAAGDVDAIATWQPHGVNAEQALQDNAVVFRGENVHQQTFNLLTRDDVITERPELVVRVLRALAKAETFRFRSPGEALAIVASASGIAQEELQRIWDRYTLTLSLDQALILTLEEQSRWAVASGLTPQRPLPNYLEAIYWKALEQVKPEAVTLIR